MKFHFSLSVKGALINWKTRDFRKMFKHENGTYYSPEEAKRALLDELSQGHEMIPMGDCDNFDYKTGCRGHRDPEERVDDAKR